MLTIGGCASGTPSHKAAAAPQQPVTAVAASTSPTPAPEPVKPTGDAINVRKVRWDSAKPVARGHKVKLVWMSGVAPCTVLHKVKVKETSRKVTITLYEGSSPKAKDVACIMLAIQKTTTVKLKHALGKRKIVDGAKL